MQIHAGMCYLDKQNRMGCATAPLTSWNAPALGALLL